MVQAELSPQAKIVTDAEKNELLWFIKGRRLAESDKLGDV